MFDQKLVDQGIKIEFDYESLPLRVETWRNYCATSIGIPIDFDNSSIVNLIISEAITNSKFLEHGTNLSIHNCDTSEHWKQLMNLLDYLPNLKYLEIKY